MHHAETGQADAEALRLLQLSEGFGVTRALQLAAELGIADLLTDGPRTTEDLARATDTHPPSLYRLLRALAGSGVFTEVERGRFGLTPIADRLRGDHPHTLRSWVTFQGLFNHAYADAMHGLRTGDPTVPLALGASLFPYLDGHPDKAALFNDAMAEHSRVMGGALLDAYDFAGARQIVDVGGGDGSFLCALLAAQREITGVIFEQPYVAEAARKRIAESGLEGRCSFVPGDFLREVPPGADLYMLKGVIHNWDDDDALRILGHCRSAMGTDGRLLLFEWVVPTGDTPHLSKLIDLSMLLVYGGRERTEEEFQSLLTAAGLRLVRVLDTASSLKVVEAISV